MAPLLACLGFGYSAAALARRMKVLKWRIAGTTRSARHEPEGVDLIPFDGAAASERLRFVIARCDAVLISIPPDADGCPAYRALAGVVPQGAWIGYLSTTGVYGDHGGGWVFEDSPLHPLSDISSRRVTAEAQWRGQGAHVFRLPGIYGPGRSAIDRLKAHDARRIAKPGQVFSRAHVEDIAAALALSIAKPNLGRVYNICDDEPAPPQDVIAYAAQLMGITAPPIEPFATANLSPMAQRFYAESKRVSNARAKAELGWRPQFPTYREGLAAILSSTSPGTQT
jgi:nucleoside-diphosphate-sugar epimerase